MQKCGSVRLRFVVTDSNSRIAVQLGGGRLARLLSAIAVNPLPY